MLLGQILCVCVNCKMDLHFHSAFPVNWPVKALYNTCCIHPFTHTLIHWWQRQPCQVKSCTSFVFLEKCFCPETNSGCCNLYSWLISKFCLLRVPLACLYWHDIVFFPLSLSTKITCEIPAGCLWGLDGSEDSLGTAWGQLVTQVVRTDFYLFFDPQQQVKRPTRTQLCTLWTLCSIMLILNHLYTRIG